MYCTVVHLEARHEKCKKHDNSYIVNKFIKYVYIYTFNIYNNEFTTGFEPILKDNESLMWPTL